MLCDGDYARALDDIEKDERANKKLLHRLTMSKTFIPGKQRHRLELGAGISKCSQIEPLSSTGKVGRNDPCPCGSEVKHKRCCMK